MEEFIEITIKIKKNDLEMVEAFVNQCGGEVLPTKRRKRARERPSEDEENASQPAPVLHVAAMDENNPVDSMEAGTADALSPNVEAAGQESEEVDMCVFCRQTPCITTDSRDYLGFCVAHVQNHVRRRKDYKTYWSALKKCGLWKDPVYLARKVELDDHVDAVGERMPKCVVKDVRSRFPNPPGIPYMGHKRE